MSYLFEYLIFLAEAITIVVALLIVISAVASVSLRTHNDGVHGHLRVTKVNDQLRGLRHVMEATLLPAGSVKKQHKQEAKAESQAQKALASELKTKQKAGQDKSAQDKSEQNSDEERTRRVFVLHFEGDIKASNVDHLRLEVSAILTMANEADEVVLCLESPGGMVHSYGLAASQLTRIRDKGIPLTAVVDMVAASGGYLMAAVANRVLAAPFALVGSIGVVAQIPNLHRLLKKNDIDVEVLTAGKYKRTLTVLGENTDEAREKFVAELEDVHALFQEFVAENRPGLDLEIVATGEAWYGKRALALGLVDELSTSDEYLMSLCEEYDVYSVQWVEHKKPIDRLLGKVNTLLDQASSALDMWRK